ncbi:2722_t:CDS:2, partial [Cetraspora pellucida]
MPPSKKNFGPCAIENCQYETSNFCNFTELAAKKAQKKPNRNNPNYFKINKTFQNLQKTEKSFKLKWDNIYLEILDDKI